MFTGEPEYPCFEVLWIGALVNLACVLPTRFSLEFVLGSIIQDMPQSHIVDIKSGTKHRKYGALADDAGLTIVYGMDIEDPFSAKLLRRTLNLSLLLSERAKPFVHDRSPSGAGRNCPIASISLRLNELCRSVPRSASFLTGYSPRNVGLCLSGGAYACSTPRAADARRPAFAKRRSV